MRSRVSLIGGSAAFTEVFRKTIEDCGVEAGVETGGNGPWPGLAVFEVKDRDGLNAVPGWKGPRPYLIFTELDLAQEELAVLKESGLMGVLSGSSTPEEVSLALNKALFYDRMLRKNPRVPVDIPVEVRAAAKTIKTFCSLLSRDGMFIVTLNPLPVDSICGLVFTPPGGGELRTKIKVLYNIPINKDLNIIASPRDPFKRLVTHPGMAVLFIDLPEGERAAIDRYIESIE
ncbi:MAG: PilZ domain-containing protein [Deltaproteobacteria bacterium]|nr:PilZ domain-containing protein [Deltaproteobacteria bacterium]